VLALEGRFENFTVGRAIEWQKVHEIYQLGLNTACSWRRSRRHGVFSDADIARVRELALAARARQVAGRKDSLNVLTSAPPRGAGPAIADHGPSTRSRG